LIKTVAGNGSYGYGGDGGPATLASLRNPNSVAVDASGNIYIADTWNYRIRMVTKSTGIITTVAGNGSISFTGDGGLATSEALSHPRGVAIDVSGNIYIADTSNNCIRMVTKSTGIITTVAGNGSKGFSGDGGQATSATLFYPYGVAVDASGNIYIADTWNHRIRMVTKSTGIITTVAGGDSRSFYGGDGGLATSAGLNHPYGVAIDLSGNVYIADTRNHRVRMVTKSTSIITTVAGDGSPASSGDGGQATSAEMYLPCGVAVDASGNIYIAVCGTQHIRMVTKSTGIITTVAGSGLSAYSGDGGPATSAGFDPSSVAVDLSGNVYIADAENNRIRQFALPAATTAAPTTAPNATPTAKPTDMSSGASPMSSASSGEPLKLLY
jgi:trimeric autotransporter adhesin